MSEEIIKDLKRTIEINKNFIYSDYQKGINAGLEIAVIRVEALTQQNKNSRDVGVYSKYLDEEKK